MAVTSQMRSADYFGDMAIADWRAAGLLKPSVIKPVFATVEKSLILKKLGRINNQDLSTLQASLQTILGE